MANMSYCMFENTVQDMEDCIDNIESFNEKEASEYELEAFEKFFKLCQEALDKGIELGINYDK